MTAPPGESLGVIVNCPQNILKQACFRAFSCLETCHRHGKASPPGLPLWLTEPFSCSVMTTLWWSASEHSSTCCSLILTRFLSQSSLASEINVICRHHMVKAMPAMASSHNWEPGHIPPLSWSGYFLPSPVFWPQVARLLGHPCYLQRGCFRAYRCAMGQISLAAGLGWTFAWLNHAYLRLPALRRSPMDDKRAQQSSARTLQGPTDRQLRQGMGCRWQRLLPSSRPGAPV